MALSDCTERWFVGRDLRKSLGFCKGNADKVNAGAGIHIGDGLGRVSMVDRNWRGEGFGDRQCLFVGRGVNL